MTLSPRLALRSAPPRGAVVARAALLALTSLTSLTLASCGAKTGLSLEPLSDAGWDAAPEPDAYIPCVPGDIALSPATSTVVLVLDRSRSMSATFSGTSDRWDVLVAGLEATLPEVDATMAIGGFVYPSDDADASCSVSGSVLVPAVGNASTLLSTLRATSPGGATPTADALERAHATLVGLRTASSARALVLATDGGPDCNADLDPSTCTCIGGAGGCSRATRCLDDARTVARIASYAEEGLPTYVLGIAGDDEAELVAVLDAMAEAGGRPSDGDHAYYAARSEAELDAALETIRDQVAFCTYLTTSVPDPRGSLTVTVDGVVVPYDATGENGWQWVDEANGELVVRGASCDAIGAGSDVHVVVECSDAEGG